MREYSVGTLGEPAFAIGYCDRVRNTGINDDLVLAHALVGSCSRPPHSAKGASIA